MSEMEAALHSIGRPFSEFGEPFVASDVTFGARRLDGETVKNAEFKHCTFVNISFKEAVVRSGTFIDCTFVGCYFRRTELVDSSFVGCRFIDCQFPHVAVKSCRFPYSWFRRCSVPFEELKYNWPPEPNIREALARNLSIESGSLGLSEQARSYRMAELEAREQHLRAAITGHSKWYREHFDALARFRATAQLSLSLLNRWLWGYGERISTLVRNLIVMALVAFPGAFYMVRDGFTKVSGDPVTIGNLVHFSLENIMPPGVQSNIEAVGVIPRVLAGVESVFGVVVIGLFAAYIFRWSLHR